MNILDKANELVQMVNNASSVFLVAHKDLDLDAINSCIGMDFYLKAINKKSYIIIDDKKQELGVKKVLDNYCDNIKIIKSKEIDELKDENSLLIILDTNKVKLVQNPDILLLFNKIRRLNNIKFDIVQVDDGYLEVKATNTETDQSCSYVIDIYKGELNVACDWSDRIHKFSDIDSFDDWLEDDISDNLI